jgi:hypothetical protein
LISNSIWSRSSKHGNTTLTSGAVIVIASLLGGNRRIVAETQSIVVERLMEPSQLSFLTQPLEAEDPAGFSGGW